MCAERVLILSDQPLFAQGVRQLVESNLNAQIFIIETYAEDTLSRICSLKPDIIILGDKTDLPNAIVAALLDSVSNIQIVRLSMEENVMHVYQGHQVTAHSGQDLINILNSLAESTFLDATGNDGKEVRHQSS